jgi:hypothetical protein
VDDPLSLLFGVVGVKVRIFGCKSQNLEVVDLDNLVLLGSLDGIRLFIDILDLVLVE